MKYCLERARVGETDPERLVGLLDEIASDGSCSKPRANCDSRAIRERASSIGYLSSRRAVAPREKLVEALGDAAVSAIVRRARGRRWAREDLGAVVVHHLLPATEPLRRPVSEVPAAKTYLSA